MNKILCLALASVLVLAACAQGSMSNFPSYKLKVVQGNELDTQALRHLQAGMSREQVQALLGTPLLQDAFNAQRWDYVFVVTRNGVVRENTSLVLYFDNNGLLQRAEGDALTHLQAAPAAAASAVQ